MIRMYRRRLAGLFAAAALVALVGLAGAQSGTAADASHVKAVFTQMGVPVEGRFARFDATVDFDPADPANARARIVIDTASFELGPGAEEYAAETRRPEWFDVARHPQAIFEASGATPGAGGRYEFAGRLEMKGHSAELRGPFTVQQADGKSIFEGEVPISRLAFGIGDGEWRDTSILADQVLVRFRLLVASP